jgi:imidazolonepropionase-like amidohydrolase
MRRRTWWLLLSVLLPAGPALAAPSGVLAIRGARIHTVTKGVIERGTVLVEGGRIKAVGRVEDVAVPEGAEVREAEGLVLIPGLVDTHSHLGVYSRPDGPANSDGNETTGPVQALVRAADSLQPADPGVRMAVAGGVTTANVMPGSANVIGGQTAYVKLRGRTVEEMLIDLGERKGGLKMANGENPKRAYGSRKQSPLTRMKVMELQREAFAKAAAYRDRRAKAAEKAGAEAEPFERDLSLEPLVEVLEGKRTVHFHTHRADDVMSAMRLAEEFGFEVVLHHVTEAYVVADEIAKRGHAVSLILLDSPGGKYEATGLRLSNPAVCRAAGLRVAIHTDDPITDSRLFLRSGALAVRGGLDAAAALEALTIEGARILHLEDRIGSIEPGKDADLVLLSGDPTSVWTQVLATWIEGSLVFDRSRPEDARYATGGWSVRDRLPPTPFPPARPPPAPRADGRPSARAKLPAPRFAIAANRVHTAAGPAIDDAVVLVDGGKILKVGRRADVPIPADWPVVTAAEVTPGLIDAHSSVGLSGWFNVAADQDQDEKAEPEQAALRVLDGFNPHEPLLHHLLEHGVTLLQVMPGPVNPIAGQAAIFRTTGRTAESMTVRSPSAILFNLGEGPKEAYGSEHKAPGTRMGVAALIRKALVDAANPVKEGKEDAAKALGRRALLDALERKIPAVFAAWREDDVVTALRIGREFGLRTIVSQATDAWLARDALRAEGVPVLYGPVMQRPTALQTLAACLETPALLAQAKVPFCLTSGFESYVPKTRVILFEAGLAASRGLSTDAALRAVTIDAARILGLADRYGSIEVGKAADLVLFDGDPFEYSSHVERVLVDGRLAFDRGSFE